MSRSEEFSVPVAQDDLSDEQKHILDFAGTLSSHPGVQLEQVAREFGYHPTTFFQRLRPLLNNPKAAEYAPHTVKRYSRVIEKSAARSERYRQAVRDVSA